MKRRDFLSKTGSGLSVLATSHLGLSAKPGLKSGKEWEGINLIHGVSRGNLDIESIRKDFPPLKELAYMDTAFTGLMPRQVKAAHDRFLEERYLMGPFPPEKTILGVWMNKMEEVRTKVAAFLGAKENEIAYTMCTGCGSNIALKGIDWKKGDNAVIDDLEYPTDFHILNTMREWGVDIRIARHKNGIVTPEQFEALTDKNTRAIVVSHVSYLNGFRHNLKRLAEIIHAQGGYLIVDAAQSIGGIRVNVREEDVDFLTGIPYKWLNGPNGIGFLFVREKIIPTIPPDRVGWMTTNDFKSLETMESNPLPNTARRYEYGTLAFESLYALDAAVDYINRIGIEAIEQRNLMLVKMLREGLNKMGVNFFTPENNLSPILSFYMENEREKGKKIREKKVYITARRWDRGQFRLSPHFYNNEEDINRFFHAFSNL